MSDRKDRPGLLLMCHGDFPDEFLTVEMHREVQQQCQSAMGSLRDHSYGVGHVDDEFTRMGEYIAAHLSLGLRLDHLALSYLGPRLPGVRQAVYNAVSQGSYRIVCAGASGMLMPGYGASESLPGELKGIIRDNPALDITLAHTGIDAADIALLVRLSLEYAFKGTSPGDRPIQQIDDAPMDTGVVLICSHDPMTMGESNVALNKFGSASAMLSALSRVAYVNKGRSAVTNIMGAAASLLKNDGFHAVEAGFIDFALPDVREAARRLIDAGATHIIATGMPSLLHRHPFSFLGPLPAVEQLKKSLPGTDIIYVKTDPAPIAGQVARLIKTKILDADSTGMSLKNKLREL